MEMLNKFRQKTLFLNLLLTSLVVLTALFAVYLALVRMTNAENRQRLESISGLAFPQIYSGTLQSSPADSADDQTQTAPSGDSSGDTPGDLPGDVTIGAVEDRSQSGSSSGEQLRFFGAKVDEDGVLLSVNSPSEIAPSTYRKAVRKAWMQMKEQDKTSGELKLNGRHWIYRSAPESNLETSEGTDGSYSVTVTSGSSYALTFLDVSSGAKMMRELTLLMIIIAFLVVAAVFWISRMSVNRSMRPVEEAWERQRRFIADASHELKTPLSIITSNYDVLMEAPNETIASQQKWLSYMKMGMDRMSGLVERLLTLTRLENENRTIELTARKDAFDLRSLLEEQMSAMTAETKRRGLQVDLHAEEVLPVVTDRSLTEQLFSAVWDNAVKYTDDHGRIEIRLSVQENFICCTVKNTGAPIPDDALPHIFDRFYRAGQSRGFQSYGLGLSIAQACARQLGGELKAYNDPDSGMVAFQFTIKNSL